jgi:hypothetical protein
MPTLRYVRAHLEPCPYCKRPGFKVVTKGRVRFVHEWRAAEEVLQFKPAAYCSRRSK